MTHGSVPVSLVWTVVLSGISQLYRHILLRAVLSTALEIGKEYRFYALGPLRGQSPHTQVGLPHLCASLGRGPAE